MSRSIEVVSVNVSEQKGTVKLPRPQIAIDASGVVGDAHAGHGQPGQPVGTGTIDLFARETGRTIQPGEFAENITVRSLDLRRVALLDRFRFSDVELEVTQIGKECHGRAAASSSNSASA